MLDGDRLDDKIIAVPFNDPTFSTYKSIDHLPSHVFEEMRHFFSIYKALENKETAVDEVRGPEDAMRIIDKAIADYKDHF
jgi:inorganic pyrophosphatase